MPSNDIDIRDVLNVVNKRKKTIFCFVGFITILSAIISFLLPKYYKSEGVLLPMGGGQQNSGMAAMLTSQLGISGLSSGGSATQLTAILNSKTLAENVIRDMNLFSVFFPKLWDIDKKEWKIESPAQIPQMEDAVDHLKGLVLISEDTKKNLIRISALTKDPKLSADLVNNYILMLQKALQQHTYSSAKRYRIYLESQLERKKLELLEIEKELFSFYKTKNISDVNPFLKIDIASDQKPVDSTNLPLPAKTDPVDEEMFKNAEKITWYENQLNNLKSLNETSTLVEQVPQQAYLMYLMSKQKVLEQLVILLTQRNEMARMEEVKEDLNFQVIDWGREAFHREKPKRKLIVLMSCIASIFMSVFYVFFKEYLAR